MPVHAKEAYGGSGGIALLVLNVGTVQMEVSGQYDASAALHAGQDSATDWVGGCEGSRTGLDTPELLCYADVSQVGVLRRVDW